MENSNVRRRHINILANKTIFDAINDINAKIKMVVKWQTDFRKNYSTEIAVQYVTECWRRCFEENETVVAVFLDFKRAIKTIDRKRLLKKLENYKINGTVLNFF